MHWQSSTRSRPAMTSHVAPLILLLSASLWTQGFLSVDAQQPAVAPIRVSTEDQLVAAYRLGRPILVTKSIFLGGPLPPVNHSLSISGDPSTCPREKRGYCRVDCKKKCRQFVVEAGGELTLKNIMIARGVAPVAESAGGAILVKAQGTVTATVVIFRFNGARGSTSGGGAVEVENGGVFNASNCYFLRNFAGFGGAVAGAKTASISVVTSFFNRNVALTAGGAVSLVLNSTAKLVNNDYHGNTAVIGGAIHVDGSTASICRAWDSPNNASLVGPQVYAANYAKILACRLSYNFVVLTAGATVVADCNYCTL